MKNLYIKLVMLLFTVSVTAQQKLAKIDQSIRADKDVTIDLNTSHTNIEVETWNKDYIEIEAFIESKTLSKEQLQKAIDDWNVSVTGNGDNVKITSTGARGIWSDDIGSNIFDEESLQALTNIPLEFNINLGPILEAIEAIPDLEAFKDIPEHLEALRIPKSPDGTYNIDFDYDKYKEEGEAYLDSWSKKYREEYGEEYEAEMREWAKSFSDEDVKRIEEEMEKWGEKLGNDLKELFDGDFEKKMEEWGKDFEKNFEKNFGKDFEIKIEAWGERFGKKLEKSLGEIFGEESTTTKKTKAKEEVRRAKAKNRINEANYNINKTIKIKMPKKAKLKLNVKHGELRMASVLENVKGDLAHSTLLANSIDGSDTSINVSFSEVKVKNWNAGELNLKYVENAQIVSANDIMLNAVSSNIDINNLSGNGIIDGSFGDLTIRNISDSFNNLNIVLENSDALLRLPKNTDFNLFFKGNRSKFNNESTSNKTIKSNSNSNANKTIVINAKYSNVVTK